jgi:hypothetical protein
MLCLDSEAFVRPRTDNCCKGTRPSLSALPGAGAVVAAAAAASAFLVHFFPCECPWPGSNMWYKTCKNMYDKFGVSPWVLQNEDVKQNG